MTKTLSPEHRAKISAWGRGRPKSAQHIEKIRLAHISRALAAQYPGKLPPGVVERRRYLKKNYGLTEDAFAAMLAAQGGRCAICRTDDPGRTTWHVDHCHATGRIRGLLCFRCNAMLGSARDTPATLRAAIAYLERSC